MWIGLLYYFNFVQVDALKKAAAAVLAFGRAYDEPRVVVADGGGANENRVARRANLVDPVEVRLTGDLHLLPAFRGDLAVRAHGRVDERVGSVKHEYAMANRRHKPCYRRECGD